MNPEYVAPFEPRFPCREMPTRHCPVVYNGQCGDVCARFESNDSTPWIGELDAGYVADRMACQVVGLVRRSFE